MVIVFKKKSKIPIGVKLSAFIYLFYSFLFIFLSIPSIIFILGGARFLLFLIGILFLLLSHGLWKGKNWTKVTSIIISSIIFILGLIEIMGITYDILELLIRAFFVLLHLLVVVYLLFSKDAKNFFKKNKVKELRLSKEEKKAVNKVISKIENNKNL